jgi:serine-type D-Ala-D-Ala carboxypeptidase/endopeptidase
MHSGPYRSVVMVLFLVFLGGLTSSLALAQNAPLSGDYLGKLGPLRLALHVHAAADGTLRATLDSIDQGSRDLPCTDLKLAGSAFSFSVPSVQGNWKGSVSPDWSLLTGTWSQGTPMPLTFTRDTFVAAAAPAAIDGAWRGVLSVRPQASLPLQFVFRSDRDGKEYCTIDSPDQNAWGIECGSVHWDPPQVAFDAPSIKAHFAGTLSTDSKEIGGVFSQSRNIPITLTRQSEPLRPPPIPKVTFGPADAPLNPSQVSVVIARDLQTALRSGTLSRHGAGVAMGVLKDGKSAVLVFGAAQKDSIFEIGSITKTFTGLLFAQMISQSRVTLNEPVRALLPHDAVGNPAEPEIALVDLVTQHSGLPRLPSNFSPANPGNPYADYTAAMLYQFLAKHGLTRPADAPFLYSNLGFGLLGQLLANAAQTGYPQLIAEEVTRPLRLGDTVVALSTTQKTRLIPGHAEGGQVDEAWDFDALAGAGALHSTVADMLSYLSAQLHPNEFPQSPLSTARTMSAALKLSQELRAEAGPGTRIAFGWLYDEKRGEYWHNGGTGGYSSYVFFNPTHNYAGVVLLNISPGSGELADRLGEHLSQRLAGEASINIE